jgi:GntR family transcriptional regulator / MocR family aminotransferase
MDSSNKFVVTDGGSDMLHLTPKLDPNGHEALYMQLYRYIRDEIMAGAIPSNARMPSIRLLAAHLGVSRTPIALAYEQLLAEGYLLSKPRSGYYASDMDGSFAAAPDRDSKARMDRGSLSREERSEAEEGEPPVRWDFGYGGVDLQYFPYAKWRKLMNRCLWPESGDMLSYGDYQGDPQLRQEIASYLRHTRGVRCAPEQIVIGAGTYHSLDLLFQLLRGTVDCIAAEEAVNEGVKALFEQHRYAIRSLPLDNDGIQVEEAELGRAGAVYVTPSHQFPYGMTLSIAKRLLLLHWAIEQDAYIIENDYDGEFRYGGRPIPSLQSLDQDGRVIYVGTFSKVLTPSFRLSYLVLPPKLLHVFRAREHSYDQLASPIFQHALRMFMQSGDCERHMRRMKKIYQRKHASLLDAIERSFGGRAQVIGAGSGLHVLLRVRNAMTEAQLVRSARAVGIRVYPASIYALSPKQAAPPTVLLGFGGIREEEIADAIGLLAQAWGKG